MTQREPNALARLVRSLPGYHGYVERKERRSADQRLRHHVAERLDRVRRHVDELALGLTDAGRLDDLEPAGRLRRRLGTCADSLRWAEAGGSGLLDEIQVEAADLDRLHAHDAELHDRAEDVAAAVHAIGVETFGDRVGEAIGLVDGLLESIERRREAIGEVFACRS